MEGKGSAFNTVSFSCARIEYTKLHLDPSVGVTAK